MFNIRTNKKFENVKIKTKDEWLARLAAIIDRLQYEKNFNY